MVIGMGYVRCRRSKSGKARYTGVYCDVRGKERSAGTFARQDEASRAWKSAEARVIDGRYLDVDAGRRRFASYATETWLLQFAGESSTIQLYGLMLEKYLLPEFGDTRMVEVTPGRVRAYFAMLRESGVGAATIDKCHTVLCSLFNTAVNDRVVGCHPVAGVPGNDAPEPPLRVVTPAEFARILGHLRDERSRLFVELALESGCRWGELAELRVGDLDPRACTLTIARTVVELDPHYTPDGEGGFEVKNYPKNRTWRKVALTPDLVERLQAYLGPRRERTALMFPATGRRTRAQAETQAPTEQESTFRVGARTFTHGTAYAYTVGACRCEQCRTAMADYRAGRRTSGHDRPPAARIPAHIQQARHMRGDWFRNRVWHPAVKAAGLDWEPRVHDLRHASASWALAGGATVQQVRDHLGHVSLRAIERYLHNLPGAETAALSALTRIRDSTAPALPTMPPTTPRAPVPVPAATPAHPIDPAPMDRTPAAEPPATGVARPGAASSQEAVSVRNQTTPARCQDPGNNEYSDHRHPTVTRTTTPHLLTQPCAPAPAATPITLPSLQPRHSAPATTWSYTAHSNPLQPTDTLNTTPDTNIGEPGHVLTRPDHPKTHPTDKRRTNNQEADLLNHWRPALTCNNNSGRYWD
jgi:integrase